MISSSHINKGMIIQPAELASRIQNVRDSMLASVPGELPGVGTGYAAGSSINFKTIYRFTNINPQANAHKRRRQGIGAARVIAMKNAVGM